MRAGLLVLAGLIGIGLVWSVQDMEADARAAKHASAVTAPAPAESFLDDILPYYRQDPPTWCQEDMPCWIGSSADGRSPQELIRDLPADLKDISLTYAQP